MRTTLLFIHILAAGTWFGTNVVQIAINPRIRTYPAAVGTWWLRRVVRFGTRIYSPVAVLLLITGVFLVLDESSAYEFSDAFVSIGFAMVIVGAGLGILVFGPRGEKAAAAIESGDDAEAAKQTTTILRFGFLDMGLLTVTILAMVAKWGV